MRKSIYLIRHGESEFNAKKIVQGHLDTFLTERGASQARYAGEYLKGKNIKKIVSSDLTRAKQTAQIIGEVIGLEVSTDSRIREMKFGVWEGMSYEYIHKNHMKDFYNWLSNPVKYPIPKQEDVVSFEWRLKSFLEDIKKCREESILVVGHGGSIQGILCIAFGVSMENLWRMRHDNTGISLIESVKGNLNVKFVNISFHLEKFEEKSIVML